ncbi:DUF6192 family protein [Streptomyces sp. NPDC005953]|uniref:DUF6192 family protein n=1 Tax=Streptomyces sp. NPDC005953 TaxID=3156719 RepID=UPI00340EC819
MGHLTRRTAGRDGRSSSKTPPQEEASAFHTLPGTRRCRRFTGDLLRRPTVVDQVRQEDKVRAVEEQARDDHVAAHSEITITCAD